MFSMTEATENAGPFGSEWTAPYLSHFGFFRGRTVGAKSVDGSCESFGTCVGTPPQMAPCPNRFNDRQRALPAVIPGRIHPFSIPSHFESTIPARALGPSDGLALAHAVRPFSTAL